MGYVYGRKRVVSFTYPSREKIKHMQRKTGRLCSHGRGGGERTRRTGGRRRASAGRLIRRDGCVELSLIRWALGVESEKKKTVVVRVLCSAGKIVVHAFGALRVWCLLAAHLLPSKRGRVSTSCGEKLPDERGIIRRYQNKRDELDSSHLNR